MTEHALFFDKDNSICLLCPHRCKLSPGKSGNCHVRIGGHIAGSIELPYKGVLSAMAIDPIEKKPLRHFHPGTNILSIGMYGCNMRCPFCQNFHISHTLPPVCTTTDPLDIISKAKQHSSFGIAWTYSEPLVHIEYLLNAMPKVHDAKLKNVLVTNGCVESEAAEAVLDYCDAVNVDLKSFNSDTYKNTLLGDLARVTNFIETALKKNVHVEISTLVVSHMNDTQEELLQIAEYIHSLSPDIPWHLAACHPTWKYNGPATSAAILHKTMEQTSSLLKYIYLGNI